MFIACWAILTLALAGSAFATTFDEVKADYDKLAASQRGLIRQNMLQYLYINSRARADGDSGVKQIRSMRIGTRPYYTETHSGNSVMSIHEHANNVRTMGMGEFVAVLNGIEFRTRHNDYGLRRASTTTNQYHKVEEIPFPEVPESVTKQSSIKDQVEEMRKYFEAWAKQDTKIRDYTPYFKPVLCYLEGAWTKSVGSIEESFESDRHFIDAKNWYDLEEKIRFNAYSGTKDNLENFAYLPRTIVGMNGTFPELAQWNYRILCHPLNNDLPLKYLRVVDDLATRMSKGKSIDDFEKTRAARFTLAARKSNHFREGSFGPPHLLDQFMAEIPGKDNYNAELEDTAYGMETQNVINQKKLNAAYYHRKYKVKAADAMGQQSRSRGYSDASLFMAMNTQDKVVGMDLEYCRKNDNNKEVCTQFNQKWSYAVPLEIIYMTPLSKWNPYNIDFHGRSSIPEKGGRKGNSEDAALNGTSTTKYFITPAEFYTGSEVNTDAADTSGGDVFVLNKNGNAKRVRASGHRIFMPEIEGVGVLRQRYPIAPIYGEGSTIMKEVEALKDIVLSPSKYSHMYRESPFLGGDSGESVKEQNDIAYRTQPSTAQFNNHQHVVKVSPGDMSRLKSKRSVTLTTEQMDGHVHQLVLEGRFDASSTMAQIILTQCDGMDGKCFDGHGGVLIPTAS